MAINKVVDRNNNTLLDLTFDTVTSNKVLAGETFHDKYGNECIGSFTGNNDANGYLDMTKYNFIDYDGNLLYSFTDEELDGLTALPAGPDHTDENLTFQEWNWTLEDLKTVNRNRPDRPIVGANLITTDGKTYMYLNTPLSGAVLSIYANKNIISIDWGDGTIDTSFTSNQNRQHTYTNPGEYIIVIDAGDSGGFYLYSSEYPSSSTNKQYITAIKFGKNTLDYQAQKCYSLKTVNIPKSSLTELMQNAFIDCRSLKAYVMPNGITQSGSYCFSYNHNLQLVSLPKTFTKAGSELFSEVFALRNFYIVEDMKSIYIYNSYYLKSIYIPSSITSLYLGYCSKLVDVDLSDATGLTSLTNAAFNSCRSLKNINIPENVTTLSGSAFSNVQSMRSLTIPDNVTTISSSSVFSNNYAFTLDLSKQTKVISITSNLGLNTSYGLTILVPQALLSEYKNASYWSQFASCMVGV